ncbi:MAG: hypothetical protein CL938_13725, partial [Deltaproteobacteria bacterium]|nr:hypothetical protein [Deltaproteobacteria bacterium]
MTTRGLIACVLGLLLSGCAIGPNFERPVVDTPAQYRGASPPAASMSPDEAEASDEAEQPVEPAGAGEAEQPVEPAGAGEAEQPVEPA